MMFESFPQWIINLFIIQSLRIFEDLNIISTTISSLSLVFGLGDALAFGATDSKIDYTLGYVTQEKSTEMLLSNNLFTTS